MLSLPRDASARAESRPLSLVNLQVLTSRGVPLFNPRARHPPTASTPPCLFLLPAAPPRARSCSCSSSPRCRLCPGKSCSRSLLSIIRPGPSPLPPRLRYRASGAAATSLAPADRSRPPLPRPPAAALQSRSRSTERVPFKFARIVPSAAQLRPNAVASGPAPPAGRCWRLAGAWGV